MARILRSRRSGQFFFAAGERGRQTQPLARTYTVFSRVCFRSLVAVSVLLAAVDPVLAESTIDPARKHAYGANSGWINMRGNTTRGVVIGSSFLSGFAWSANCGWISFGDGTPENGYSYSNASASDFGVNHHGAGHLIGYAYAANIGWITFEQTNGKPRINLSNGVFSGFAWSANCGWISLDNGVLATTLVAPGPDTDGDSIPDAWELEQGAAHGTPDNLALLTKTGDADNDGVADDDEYHADTDPFDPSDFLRVTRFEVTGVPAGNVVIEWRSSERCVYDIQTGDLEQPFTDMTGQTNLRGLEGKSSVTMTDEPDKKAFYRIEARRPLSP
jgi:hypothetical protein